MNKKEAIERFEKIESIISSKTVFHMSGKNLIIYGTLVLAMLLSIMLIEFLLKEYGYESARYVLYVLIISAVAFYASYKFTKKERLENLEKQAVNPVIEKAEKTYNPILISLCGACLVLAINGNQNLILMMVLFFAGILLNLAGQFSIFPIRLFSWSYLLLGIVIGVFHDSEILKLLLFSYLGLSLIVMGVFLKKADK